MKMMELWCYKNNYFYNYLVLVCKNSKYKTYKCSSDKNDKESKRCLYENSFSFLYFFIISICSKNLKTSPKSIHYCYKVEKSHKPVHILLNCYFKSIAFKFWCSRCRIFESKSIRGSNTWCWKRGKHTTLKQKNEWKAWIKIVF